MFKWLKKTLEINCNVNSANQSKFNEDNSIDRIAKFCGNLGCTDTQNQILNKKTELTQTTIIEREKLMKPMLQAMYCNLVFAEYDSSNAGMLSIFRKIDPHRTQVMEALSNELAELTMRTVSLAELKKSSTERLKQFIDETQKMHEEKSLLGKLGFTESRLVRCLTKFLKQLEVSDKGQSNADSIKFSANQS